MEIKKYKVTLARDVYIYAYDEDDACEQAEDDYGNGNTYIYKTERIE